MADVFYPPLAFHFRVTLDGALGNSPDASFQEVSGIKVEFGTEEVVEGGQNQFAHRLPTQAKYANLVLKRGVVVAASPLASWATTTLGSQLTRPIKLRELMVTLQNEQHDPLINWRFVNAYPLRWETSSLNAMDNAVLTETMEFAYHYFERAVVDRRPVTAAGRQQ